MSEIVGHFAALDAWCFARSLFFVVHVEAEKRMTATKTVSSAEQTCQAAAIFSIVHFPPPNLAPDFALWAKGINKVPDTARIASNNDCMFSGKLGKVNLDNCATSCLPEDLHELR